MTENLDLGLQIESLSAGVRGKYAFVNQRSRGVSFAGALGVGTGGAGSHVSGDLLVSHLADWFEPYATLRLVHAKTDPADYGDQSGSGWTIHLDSFTYEYGQAMAGGRFWFNPHWHLSVEVSSLFGITGGFRPSNTVLASLALGARF